MLESFLMKKKIRIKNCPDNLNIYTTCDCELEDLNMECVGVILHPYNVTLFSEICQNYLLVNGLP